MRIVDDTARLLRAPEITFDAAEIGLEAFGYNMQNRDLLAALDDAARLLDAIADPYRQRGARHSPSATTA